MAVERARNVVVIVADDHSAWAAGPFGNKEVRTPQLDRLASQGMRFDAAYVSTPVCSPSRATLLTGLYSTQTGITDLISADPHLAERGLEQRHVTWAQILQRRGFHTAFIGKWNLGQRPRHHPTRHGFDEFTGYYEPAPEDPFNPRIEVDGVLKEIHQHTSDFFVERAIDFLRRRQGGPFALVVGLREPQEPWEKVPQEDRRAVADIDPSVPEYPGSDAAYLKKLTRDYYGAIHTLDRSIGRIVGALENLGLGENTVVIYTGDGGRTLGHHGLWDNTEELIGERLARAPVPGLSEEAVRNPLIVRWPGVVRGGSVSRELVTLADIFPTILRMLGVEQPEDVRVAGHDFSPVLRGIAREHALPDAVFFQSEPDWGAPYHVRGVRVGRWKLVRNYLVMSDFDGLYDLEADPGEKNNLFRDARHAKVVVELEERLRGWMAQIGDPLLPALACHDREAASGLKCGFGGI